MSETKSKNINNKKNDNKVEKNMENEDVYNKSQWQLIFLRFRKHKLAMSGAVVLIILYTLAIFAPFFSPQDPHQKSLDYKQAPPQKLHFNYDGKFHFRPIVYPYTKKMDMKTFQTTFTEDKIRPTPVKLLVRGFSYKLFGLLESDIHFLGTGKEDIPLHLFGSDEFGRDLFGRILYGARISLSIGLIGVGISFILGILLGGLAGYYGGLVDEVVQRIIELFLSIPKLPLWMGLSAALPSGWSPIKVYFAITIILSLVGWTGLARVVRGKFLSLREEDFVIAAKLSGRNQLQIIFIHMLPSFLSHIIASLTLSIPGMILGETSLSFLGIGLQPPVISWGVLLKKAQNVHTVSMAPWLLIPGLFVIVTVLAFNFLGDGLRDAADPYAE